MREVMQKKIQEANEHLEQRQMFLDRLVDQHNKLSNAIQQAKMEVAAQMGFIDALNRTMEEFFPEASPVIPLHPVPNLQVSDVLQDVVEKNPE